MTTQHRMNDLRDAVTALDADVTGALYLSLRHHTQTQAEATAAAVESLHHVQSLAAAVERELVADLRSQGSSWAAIGDAYGISRQAAQQRFGERS